MILRVLFAILICFQVAAHHAQHEAESLLPASQSQEQVAGKVLQCLACQNAHADSADCCTQDEPQLIVVDASAEYRPAHVLELFSSYAFGRAPPAVA